MAIRASGEKVLQKVTGIQTLHTYFCVVPFRRTAETERHTVLKCLGSIRQP